MNGNALQRGFTLSETLGVLAVMGIGLSLAVPGLRSLADDNHQTTGINRFVSTLHLARSEAVTRNTMVAVCASPDGEHCGPVHWERGWIAFLDTDGDAERDAGEALLDQTAALPGQELSSEEFPHDFSYRADGRITRSTADISNGEFTFCTPGAEQAARVLIVRTNGQPVLSALGQDGRPASCRPS